VGIFDDIQKAFDTVEHSILLKKLKCYGIRRVANDLIKSYLTGRKQFVKAGVVESNLIEIIHGVPPRLCPGAFTLFTVYQ